MALASSCLARDASEAAAEAEAEAEAEVQGTRLEGVDAATKSAIDEPAAMLRKGDGASGDGSLVAGERSRWAIGGGGG